VELLKLLEPSKATLLKVVSDFRMIDPSKPMFGDSCALLFFKSCPKLQALCLKGADYPVVRRGSSSKSSNIPGLLSHFAASDLGFPSGISLEWFSKLKTLDVSVSSTSKQADINQLSRIIIRSAGSLESLAIHGAFDLSMLAQSELRLLKLRHLTIKGSWMYANAGSSVDAPKLKSITASSAVLSKFKLPFKRLDSLQLCLSDLEHEDYHFDTLGSLTSIHALIECHESILEGLEFSSENGQNVNLSLDHFLRFLQVSLAVSVLGVPYPEPKKLYIQEEINFSQDLLAEVLLGRRL